MNKCILSLITAMAISGCSTFTGLQTDESNEKTGIRKITTNVKARTVFDSKSGLANLKATQTDKSQNFGVGSLTQEASGTNVVSLIEAVTKGAVQGAVNAVAPKLPGP